MNEQLAVSLVFVAVFAAIISEKIDKTVVVLTAAVFLILSDFITFQQAIAAIDFNTICLLMGMMLIVEIMKELKVFDWAAIKLGLLTRGNPVLIFVVFGIATAALSALLDNVTTVLIMVPLVIALTKGMGLRPRIYILCLVFLSNIGGASTLIGDPPNILVGSLVPELTFMDFIIYMGLPAFISTVAVILWLRYTNAKDIESRDKHFTWLFLSNLMLEQMRREEVALNVPKATMIKAFGAFLIVFIGFFTHPITHIEPAVVAIAGAVLMLLLFFRTLDLHHLVRDVEWPTLLFFAGLFMIVGCMEHAGVLEVIAHALVGLTSDMRVLLLVVLWSAAILSAIVDNIPFVAVMIPVIKGILSDGHFAGHPHGMLLWWALALGACFGGNGTMVGASANVVSCAIAKSSGVEIGFRDFIKDSIPVTFISLLVSTIYILVLYEM